MNNNGNSGREIKWWVGLVAFLGPVGVFVFVGLGAGVLGLFGLLGDDPGAMLTSPLAVSIQVLFTCSVLTALAVGLTRRYRQTLTDFLALRPAGFFVTSLSIVGIVGMGLVVDEVLFFAHRVAPGRFNTEGLALFNNIFTNASPMAFFVLTAVITIGPGIGEEFFFRGFTLRVFRGGLPAWAAVVMSAALFGIIHGDMLQGTGAFLIGIYLGFVALQTGSLWPCVIAHGFNNFICAVMARGDGEAAVDVWETGHPTWLIMLAICVLAFSIYTLMILTKKKDVRSV